tara:strand:+ start:152 stop:1426 length:1275 start_codon:yes stop_codon:yes gene_type:complete
MFDVKWVRENPDSFDSGLARRGIAPKAAALVDLDQRRRKLIASTQELQEQRNQVSKQVGASKKLGESVETLVGQVVALKARLRDSERELRKIERDIQSFLLQLPNLPEGEVPDGEDGTSNVEVRRVGKPREYDFAAKQHFDLGETLGQMDFDAAAQMAGARFVVVSGQLARLERALASFMLDLHTGSHGYREINPPYMVRDTALIGTGQLPKFSDDLFCTTDDRWLIPTAEVPLTNLVYGQVLNESILPLRYTAHTPCFRSEAGAAGKDTKGMMRVHQFSKVEMVSITTAKRSSDELERMTNCAETVLKKLKLPYRVMLLSSGDMGFSAQKTYDLEVWIPGEGRYREISSCSNCGDFQARRMGSRYRPNGLRELSFVHTLNGSGLAVGRALVAVMENYQNSDGTIKIPDVLRPYMGDAETIRID